MLDRISCTLSRVLLLSLAAVGFRAAIPNEVMAQSGVGILPPTVSARDENGVDLIGGSLSAPTRTLSAGSNGSGISRTGLGYNPVMDNLAGLMTAGWYRHYSDPQGSIVNILYNGLINVSVNGSSEWFYFPNRNADGNPVSFETGWTCYPQTDYSNDQYYTGCVLPATPLTSGTTLSCSGPTCIYVMRDGGVATFARTPSYGPVMYGLEGDFGRITQLRKPDGEVINYSYGERTDSYPIYGQPSLVITTLVPRQVMSSLGWTVRYQYVSIQSQPTKVAIVNSTIDYCNPGADSCSAADQSTAPYLDGQGFYPNSGESVSTVNSVGGPWSTIYVSGYASALGGNVSSTLYPQNVWYNWNNDYKVKTLTRNGKTWSYQYSPNDANLISTTTVTDPSNATRVLKFKSNHNHPGQGRYSSITSIQDELGRTTNYVFAYPTPYVTQVISPEATYSGTTLTGGYIQYDYGPRWNPKQSTSYPKGGGTPIITYAAFPSTCTNPATCNKPTSTTDANGKITTYTYDATHGGILTETGPAVNGVQPQKRYSYSQITPYLKSSTGGMVAQSPVWRLTGTSVCKTMTLATCVGTSDEIKTSVSYGSDNTHPVYNNLLPVSQTTVAGDGSNSTTITYTYNNFGHVTSEKGPRTDVDDTRYTTYDIYGRPILQIAADPDGSGPLRRQATRTTYDAEGRPLKVEAGTTSSTSGSDFTAVSYISNTYNTTNGLLSQSQKVLLP